MNRLFAASFLVMMALSSLAPADEARSRRNFLGAKEPCPTQWGISCPAMEVSICPAGDFEIFAKGCGGTSDYIWVVVQDRYGDPISGVPTTDYWIDACSTAEDLFLCVQPIVADSLTNTKAAQPFRSRAPRWAAVPPPAAFEWLSGAKSF